MSVVLDASAGVQLILNGPAAPSVRAAIERETVVLAPDLYVAEVASTVWKYVRAGQLDAASATGRLADAGEIISWLVPSETMAAEALNEAVRLGHLVYDLLYLVTARRNAATLVTCDRRLAALCRAEGVPIADVR